MNRFLCFLTVGAILIAAVSSITISRSSKINADENAFAKECNASGGVARHLDGMLQCLDTKMEEAAALARKDAHPVNNSNEKEKA